MVTVTAPRVKYGTVGDYLSLTRPRSIGPHLLTAAAAMLLAAGPSLSASRLAFTLLGGAFVAAAANTFNSYADRDIDALMLRTRHRPLPSGQVSPNQALVLGASAGLVGVVVLSVLVNWAAAVLAAMALTYYILPYTRWLKRRTWWSTVICSGVGAFPPLIGWVSATQRLEVTPFLLSGIIMLWTLPHFWTLAIFRRADYHLAGLSMAPERGAGVWIVASSVLMVAATLLLAPVAHLGLFYRATAGLLGVVFLGLALPMGRGDSPDRAGRLYRYSIVYIAILFGAVILDTLV